jgi:hypothetical protein
VNAAGMADLRSGRVGNGARRKTTAGEDAALAAAVRAAPFEVPTQLLQGMGIDLGEQSMWQRLKEDGLKNFVAAKKINLEELHCQRLVQFAEQHLAMTPEEWKAVIFTDEKVFSTDKDSRRTVWRDRGQRYNPVKILPVHKSGLVIAAFWGWISSAGPGQLVEIDRRMDAELYIQILQEQMIPSER